MMKKIYSIFVVSIILACAGSVSAKVIDRVVAVVNDEVITQRELDKRFELTLRQMRTNIPKEQQQALYRQTLGGMVNEAIQQQYAKSIKLTVEDKEVSNAIKIIEKNNSLPEGSFHKIAHGLNDTANEQVKSEILWQKVIQRRISPRVIISNAELDRLINAIMNNDIVEKEIAQIMIPNTEATNESEVRKEIYRAAGQLRTGENFNTVAAKLNIKSSDKGRGYLGWFGPGELSPQLDEPLKNLNKGDVSEPIRTSNGWHILSILNSRTTQKLSTDPVTEYKLYKLTLPINGDDHKKKTYKNLRKISKKFKRLSDMEKYLQTHEDDIIKGESGDIGWKSEQNLSTSEFKSLEDVDPGEFTGIIEQQSKLTVIYLEDRRVVLPKKLQAYRARVRQRLSDNRIELNSRRFLRDLRRKAYIDMRL